MKLNDEMELYTHEYKNHVYYYRILDSSIESKNGRLNYRITVAKDGENGEYRLIMFNLPCDNSCNIHSALEKKIEEAADNLEKEGKTWGSW